MLKIEHYLEKRQNNNNNNNNNNNTAITITSYLVKTKDKR
jgi:hypothetical protein